MIFDSWDEAEAKFYTTHDCLSDDAEREQARVERWVESNGHVVLEDNPDAIKEPVDGAAKLRKEWVRSEQTIPRSQCVMNIVVLTVFFALVLLGIASIIIWT